MKRIISILVITAMLLGLAYFFFGSAKKVKNQAPEKIEANSEQVKRDTGKTVETINEENSEPDSVAAQQAELQTIAVTNNDYNPSIWVIEHDGKQSYLFGSIHVGEKDMYPLPKKVMDAFKKTDTLAVEIDLSKVNQIEMGQLVQQLALDLENPLPTVLSESTKQKFDQYCEIEKATCNMVNIFEPWMAAITIEAMAFLKAGYSEDLGIDKYFVKQATDKTVVELESIGSQLNMLDQMPAELQDLMLLSAISQDQDDFRQLLNAWKTGQVDSVLDKAEQEALALGISAEQNAEFNERFLYQRNRVMADGISALMEDGHSVFAVVGAAHYAGEKSVNHYLKTKGYTVTRL